MKKRILALLAFVFCTFSILALSACNEEETTSEPKNIIGTDSEKTYLKGSFYISRPELNKRILELPIVSENAIAQDEIDEVTISYRGTNDTLEVPEYVLFEDNSSGSYHYYTLYVRMTATFVYSMHIDAIKVTINGTDYIFTADITINCSNYYPEDFIFPQTYLVYGGIDEAQLMLTTMYDTTITNVMCQTDGIEITGIKVRGTDGEFADAELPLSTNGRDVRLMITYNAPDDCLYYGTAIITDVVINGVSMRYSTALSYELNLSFYGSAFSGI